MVGMRGFEPLTPSLSVTCSNQLSYMPVLLLNISRIRDFYQYKAYTENMRKYWWIIIILIIAALGLVAIFVFRNKGDAEVKIKDQSFKVELASTDSQRERGLSNRTELGTESGMLFVFPESAVHSFWMKDTLIPLDIIWINEGKIVEMATLDPQTDETIPQYTPKNSAKYVLEINAGLISTYDFKVGDDVKISY